MKPDLKFPSQFFWGCATSAHQIEGGLTNDWSEWEKSPARLKELSKNKLNHFEFISGAAANSFENNNADIACMRDLNLNAYRFSVDWSRIEPENGKFNQEALDYYLDFIKKLRAHNIEPFVTLWHWPLPTWLRDLGGWESKEIVKYFDRFTKVVATHLNSEVNFWTTLNEPTVYAGMSYLTGVWPPQKKNPLAYWNVLSNLIKAHRSAYQTLKSIDSNNQVGIAHHLIYFEPYKNRSINRLLKKMIGWWMNERFINKTEKYQDYIGLNYYFHHQINFGFGNYHKYEKSSDLDWGLHPEGIYHLLKELHKYNKPIYITENGLADKGDQHRSWYIREILNNTHRAINESVLVKGYFHWSLIDNFEWAYGIHPRFGLYEVDYKTFERRSRSSAEYYGDICKNNRVV